MRAWVWAVIRVADPLIIMVGCFSERLVGARDGAMEPLTIGVTWLNVGNNGAVDECEVEAVLAFWVSDCRGVGIDRTGSGGWCVVHWRQMAYWCMW